ncbi:MULTISPECIES: hypothetical protein [Methylobacterium]|uniref:DUF3311 domain-containing protein n=1 Tax=Methylobacterium thuringiense TaxID=1003091 RepID=A0ABQ4TMV4_9HYPH|nr:MULTISPECIES: hypothetical protein [Methylobacterium]TXN22971.1 hypothetical protein FV217_08545 [Methylobacterium sp. WL9]GJE55624.1 hypothetical protein EKPJFOCH_2119 [Methylobacterium thuringiense]
MRLPRFIQVWFALDLLLALLPPLHWHLGVAEPVLGMPCTLAYLWGASLFIAASVVAAYFADPARAVER